MSGSWLCAVVGFRTGGFAAKSTGNNVPLGEDLTRRVVWVRLDAEQARPWQRSSFRHSDLLGWAIEERPRLLAAVFTLVRAWHVAGRPPGKARLGSFEGWAQTVGGILETAEFSDFLGNIEKLVAHVDDETSAWEVFLRALLRAFRDREFTTKEIVDSIRKGVLGDVVPDSVDQGREAGLGPRLGRLLRERLNRRHGDDGIRLEEGSRDRAKNARRWRILLDSGDTGDSGDDSHPPEGEEPSIEDKPAESPVSPDTGAPRSGFGEPL